MSEQSVTTLTLGECVAWEEHQPERHELVGGRAYAMTGGTERHGLMAGHLFTLLAAGAAPKRCRTFHSDRKLQPGFNRSKQHGLFHLIVEER